MAEKIAQDIQVYDGSAWKSLKGQKVYDGSNWKDLHGVYDGTDWYVFGQLPTAIVTMVAAKQSVAFGNIVKSSDIEVDWGDGVRETNVFSHTYSTAVEHTIRFYGSSTALIQLWCSWNEVSSLDISRCMALTQLYCHSNQLPSLDVSGCVALAELDCSGNPFISDNTQMMNLANSLPDRSGKSTGTLEINNPTAQVKIQSVCDRKNWQVL